MLEHLHEVFFRRRKIAVCVGVPSRRGRDNNTTDVHVFRHGLRTIRRLSHFVQRELTHFIQPLFGQRQEHVEVLVVEHVQRF